MSQSDFEYGDFAGLVSNVITVDRYSNGEDATTVTIGIEMNMSEAANDFSQLLASACGNIVENVDVAKGKRNKQWVVLVSIKRLPTLKRHFSEVIGHVSQLVGSNDWKFQYYRDKTKLSMQDLFKKIPPDRNSYLRFIRYENEVQKELEALKMRARI